jgi:hypothetical protein
LNQRPSGYERARRGRISGTFATSLDFELLPVALSCAQLRGVVHQKCISNPADASAFSTKMKIQRILMKADVGLESIGIAWDSGVSRADPRRVIRKPKFRTKPAHFFPFVTKRPVSLKMPRVSLKRNNRYDTRIMYFPPTLFEPTREYCTPIPKCWQGHRSVAFRPH